MDYLLILNLGILVGSLISAVISAWFARKNNVRELQSDVDEIASIVEKVYRESKRQQMRRVREAAGETRPDAPPGFLETLPVSPITDKMALRRKVFGGH